MRDEILTLIISVTTNQAGSASGEGVFFAALAT